MKQEDLIQYLSAVGKSQQRAEYSAQVLLLLLLIGAVLFAAVYLIRKYVLPFIDSRKSRNKGKLILFRLEVLAWTIYLLFSLYQLMLFNIWLTVVLIAVIAIIGLNFFKDFFPGLMFRLENRYKEGDLLRIGDYSGEVTSIGVRNLQLKTDDEELVLVPFYRMSNIEITKLQAKGRLISTKISLSVEEEIKESIRTKIPSWLRVCPWAIIHEKVQISDSGENKLSVSVQAVDQESLNRISQFIQRKIDAL